MQRALQQLKYDIGSTGADGIFGKATQAAVEQFQRDQDLPVTGAWNDSSQQSLLNSSEENDTERIDVAERLKDLALEITKLAEQLST